MLVVTPGGGDCPHTGPVQEGVLVVRIAHRGIQMVFVGRSEGCCQFGQLGSARYRAAWGLVRRGRVQQVGTDSG